MIENLKKYLSISIQRLQENDTSLFVKETPYNLHIFCSQFKEGICIINRIEMASELYKYNVAYFDSNR